MKKLFCILLYLPLIFSSCKEEEEEVILSNDIIVGDWVLYHKEIFDSDNNLSFSANNAGDSETTTLSIKSDYTWSAPGGFAAQPVSNLWATTEFWFNGNYIGVWIKNEYGFYRFTDDDSAINCQDAFFYCNNNIVVLQIGGHQGSNQNKQLYYFQRTGYNFSDCDEISYNENP